MKRFLLSIFVIFVCTTNISASSIIASVKSVNGNVKVKSEGSFKKSKVDVGLEIKKGDLITTGRKASAVISLNDGSTLVLDRSTTLLFESVKLTQQQKGKVYYKITSRDAKNAIKVKTPFAIIGIKGTTFVVTVGENSSVKLKEGLVGIQSVKEEFELYKKQIETEYQNYLQEQLAKYQRFLNEQEEGLAEMTKEFDLKAGNTVSFNGQKVDEEAFTEDDEAEFKHFEELIGSIK
ncbi:MAG: FecR domain-containing protein [Sulfurimonas sp.]|nr:FecR domain-containing protein [Sulfurimonas sp.]